MTNEDTQRDSEHVGRPDEGAREADEAASQAVGREQALSDADQRDSEADQAVSEADQASAETDQHASNRDQAAADRERSSQSAWTDLQEGKYELSRVEREIATSERIAGVLRRERTARNRRDTAVKRASLAEDEDDDARARDYDAIDPPSPVSATELALLEQLERVRAEAAADRRGAASDRARAAEAVRERDRLEAELRSAHLDGLTGAYRREMGALAIGHEIERMRRTGSNLVLAFIDVDGLKEVNDRLGHAAGDRALQAVARLIRERLRAFDPIVRYGGDEFICVLGDTSLPEAERRFQDIGAAIEKEAGVGISVGFATLSATDTADELTERADAAMLEVKRQHHRRGLSPKD